PPPASRQPARAAQRQKRKSSTGVVIALTVLGLLAVAALSIGLYLANQDPLVRVPQLTGRTQAEASDALRQSNLQGDPHPGPTENCKAGIVIGQHPAADVQVKQGSQVDYDVCGEPQTQAVPPLVRASKDQAIKTLQSMNLGYTVVEKDGVQPKD